MVALCFETKDNPRSSQCNQQMSWTIQNKQLSYPKTIFYCGMNKTFLGSNVPYCISFMQYPKATMNYLIPKYSV